MRWDNTSFYHFNTACVNCPSFLSQLQNALLSFAEMTEQYPEDLQKSAKFSQELEPTDDTGKTVSVKEFVQVRPFG